ncbi:hypothetical protein DSAG12_03341 [Promethearchaeum syntrophicum]|uniref:Uncharacterized protein n=1 Tax=Promethearchaeum syntrophicum TaxID=2594042 RepID=A0A5B9DEG5_9ARCH|nr:hypothetical protein [Candidatus Prometheoarchaeum syntrophicum]QEE17504.1 hypothetical protein DSAG12_03341 [Candidatus Prometheoarchaeum syntrophicum]
MEKDSELTKREFIKVLGGDGINKPQLMNDNEAPLDELIHPLSYSLDTKKQPDMESVPMAYKYQRNFKKLFDELRRT